MGSGSMEVLRSSLLNQINHKGPEQKGAIKYTGPEQKKAIKYKGPDQRGN